LYCSGARLFHDTGLHGVSGEHYHAGYGPLRIHVGGNAIDMIDAVLHDGNAGIRADETTKPMGGALDLVRLGTEQNPILVGKRVAARVHGMLVVTGLLIQAA